MTKHNPYEAFRIREFRLYALGWFAALVGTQIQSAAIGHSRSAWWAWQSHCQQ
ncbi:MAG: hypothetical protein J4F29_25010 [Candidatus Latescibacteria bacterium]|nr:hypothetical protein [Candidatus Latescibacterota bacterium]